MGSQHAHSNTHTDMTVIIEYVSVITAWQNYTYTQQMHNNTWNRNTSQWTNNQTRLSCFCPFRKASRETDDLFTWEVVVISSPITISYR